MSTSHTCPDWPALMELAPELQFRHFAPGDVQIPVDAFVQLAGLPPEAIVCCDLEAHVFNPEHTDARIVEALRGTHWIDVREVSRPG